MRLYIEVSVPEWSKGGDLSSSGESLAGSNPAGYILSKLIWFR